MLGLGGFFCEWKSFDGGWPSMFYIGGGLCLLFCLVWAFTIYDSPADHPRISRREKLHIQQAMEGKEIGKVRLFNCNFRSPFGIVISTKVD